MFNYSLENVLDYKKQIEDVHKQGLSAIEEKRHAENQTVDDLRSALAKCGLLPEKGWDYQNQVDYWAQLLDQIQGCNNRLVELEQQAKLKRAEVVEAGVDRRKFEQHRDKEHQAYSKAVARDEQNMLDELGGMAYIRQQRGNT